MCVLNVTKMRLRNLNSASVKKDNHYSLTECLLLMQLSPLRLGICLMFLKQISVKCGFPAMCIKRTTRMSIGNVFLARLLVRVVALRKLCQNVTKHVSNSNIKINHLASLLAKLFKQFQLPKHRFKQRQNAPSFLLSLLPQHFQLPKLCSNSV